MPNWNIVGLRWRDIVKDDTGCVTIFSLLAEYYDLCTGTPDFGWRKTPCMNEHCAKNMATRTDHDVNIFRNKKKDHATGA